VAKAKKCEMLDLSLASEVAGELPLGPLPTLCAAGRGQFRKAMEKDIEAIVDCIPWPVDAAPADANEKEQIAGNGKANGKEGYRRRVQVHSKAAPRSHNAKTAAHAHP
jgi:hypothetical protein